MLHMAADREYWMQARMKCVLGEIEQMEHLMKCMLAPNAIVTGTGSLAYFHCCLKLVWPLLIWTVLICILIPTRRSVVLMTECVLFLHRCRDRLVCRCLQAVSAWCSWRPNLRSVWGELVTTLQAGPGVLSLRDSSCCTLYTWNPHPTHSHHHHGAVTEATWWAVSSQTHTALCKANNRKYICVCAIDIIILFEESS